MVAESRHAPIDDDIGQDQETTAIGHAQLQNVEEIVPVAHLDSILGNFIALPGMQDVFRRQGNALQLRAAVAPGLPRIAPAEAKRIELSRFFHGVSKPPQRRAEQLDYTASARRPNRPTAAP